MSIKKSVLPWSPEASALLTVIPALFRQDAKETMERNAINKDLSIVDVATVIETRDDIFNKLNIKPKDGMPKARDFLSWLIPRMMVQQGPSPVYWLDIDNTLNAIDDLDDWIAAWEKIALHFQKLAEEEFSCGHLATAKYAYLNAAMYYRWSHFPLNVLTEQKISLMQKSISSYDKAIQFFSPAIEKVAIHFEGKLLYGYFRRAPSGNKAPCIICVHGADSTKEELISHMQYAYERDMAILIFDGPGQAEARLDGITFELDAFAQSVSCAIDYLEQRDDVISDKIALWGVCLGGFLSLYSASLDKRIAACVSNGGAYNYDVLYNSMPNAWLSAFSFITGSANNNECIANLKGKLTLENVIAHIKCPVLLVHATGDKFIPLEQVQYIYEMLPGNVKLLLSEGGDHCSASFANVVWPKMFDWLADNLSNKNDPGKSIEKYLSVNFENSEFSMDDDVVDQYETLPKKTFSHEDLEFTPEAEEFVRQIPKILQKMALRNIIRTAKQRQVTFVTKELILETRKQILGF